MYFVSIAALGLGLVLASCSTSEKSEVKEFDDDLKHKRRTEGENIGVDEKGKVIVEEERDPADEMRMQEAVNIKLKEELKHESHQLKSCRRDMMDPRLGGSGEVAEIPDMDTMKQVETMEEELGLDGSGSLKMRKRSSFTERLANARKYETSMREMLRLTKKHSEECEAKMGQARIRAGLPPERYQAEGYYTADGAWVTTRKAEQSLSDAFKIQSTESAKNKKKEADSGERVEEEPVAE